MNTQPEHNGLELAEQIENLKQHLLNDANAYQKLMKSGMTLTQIFSKYDSVHEKLLVKEEEFQKLQRSYDQLSQENKESFEEMLRARKDETEEKLKAEKAQEELQSDRMCRANVLHQREKKAFEELLRQSAESRHVDNKQAAEIETELQLKHHSLMVKYSQLEEDFEKEVEREVEEQMIVARQEVDDCQRDIDRLQKCRGIVRDAYKRIDCLVEFIMENGLKVPEIEGTAQEDLDEESPTKKRTSESRDLVKDKKRRRLTEDQEEGAQLAETDYEENGEWVSSSEEENSKEIIEEEGEVNEDEDMEDKDPTSALLSPAAAVSCEYSPVPSGTVVKEDELKSLKISYDQLSKSNGEDSLDLAKALDREVDMQTTKMKKKLEEKDTEIIQLKEGLGTVKEVFKTIVRLQKENEEYLRLLNEHRIPVPEVPDDAQQNIPVVIPAPRMNTDSCELGDEENHGVEEEFEEEGEWSSSSEEEDDPMEEGDEDEEMIEDPAAAAVSFQCSSKTGLPDSIISSSSDLKEEGALSSGPSGQ